MGFWWSMEGGVIPRVTRSQADHNSRKQGIEGILKGLEEGLRGVDGVHERRGKVKGGRSRIWRDKEVVVDGRAMTERSSASV